MIDKIIIGNNEIEKHNKYKKYYKKDNLYWGLGIENELYLEFEKKAGPTTTRLSSWQRFLLTHIYPRILNPKVLFHPMC